jgi:hypothetical protein
MRLFLVDSNIYIYKAWFGVKHEIRLSLGLPILSIGYSPNQSPKSLYLPSIMEVKNRNEKQFIVNIRQIGAQHRLI